MLTVTFSTDLDTSSVPPATSFAVTVDGTERAVRGVSLASRTVTLTLATAVQAGQSVQVSYSVPASNPIRDTGSGAVAAFTAQAVANGTSARAPSLSGVWINELIVRLTYDEYLDTAFAPSASSFDIMVDGTAHDVISPMMSSTSVMLIVTPAVQAGQSVQLSYTVPSSSPIQDVGGTPAAGFASRAVYNRTSLNEPALRGSSSSESTVLLQYSGPLQVGSAPPASSFTLEVDGTERAITGVALNDKAVSLTAAGGVQAGQSLRLSYAVPSSSPIRSEGGVLAGAYTNRAIPNYTDPAAPAFRSAVLDASGSTIMLTFDEDLDTGSTPPATSFSTTVGNSVRSIASAAVRGRSVVLVLDSPVVYSPQGRVHFSYAAPSSSPIRDIGGTPASALTSRSVDRTAIIPGTKTTEPTTTEPTTTEPRSQQGGNGGSGGGGSGGGGGDLDIGVATFVVANGWSAADVGVASVLAARSTGAVVVYTVGEALSAETAMLLREASPAEVIMVGGHAAISSDVRTQISAASPESDLTRISGTDRADTAAATARRILGAPPGAGPVTLVVANGWSPPDIGAAALAARSGRSAVLYTGTDALPEASAAWLRGYQIARVILMGGTAAISADVADAIAAAASEATMSRLTGTDRVDTAAQTARRALGDPAAAPDDVTLVVANGWSPPDVGVAAALAAATENAAVVYTARETLPYATAALIREYRPSQIIIIGGRTAVAESVREAIAQALPNADVRRVTGSNRVDTAARAARRILTNS